MMSDLYRKYQRVEGKSCMLFLPVDSKGTHPTCLKCHSNACAPNSSCNICINYNDAHWISFNKVYAILKAKRIKKSKCKLDKSIVLTKFSSSLLKFSHNSSSLPDISTTDSTCLSVSQLIFL